MATFTPIYEIQGAGHSSSNITAPITVTTEGLEQAILLTDSTDGNPTDAVADVSSGQPAAIAQPIVNNLNSPNLISLEDVQDNNDNGTPDNPNDDHVSSPVGGTPGDTICNAFDQTTDPDPVLAHLDMALNNIIGTDARDLLTGTDQADRILGLAGPDLLSGGDGNDILIGGAGRDELYGGAGGDRFIFQQAKDGIDQIMDFEVGLDKIVLRPVLNSLGYTGTDPLTDGTVVVEDFAGLGSVIVLDTNGATEPLGAQVLAFVQGVTADQLSATSFVV